MTRPAPVFGMRRRLRVSGEPYLHAIVGEDLHVPAGSVLDLRRIASDDDFADGPTFALLIVPPSEPWRPSRAERSRIACDRLDGSRDPARSPRRRDVDRGPGRREDLAVMVDPETVRDERDAARRRATAAGMPAVLPRRAGNAHANGRRWLAIVRGDRRPTSVRELLDAIDRLAAHEDLPATVVRDAIDAALVDAGGLDAWCEQLRRPRLIVGGGAIGAPRQLLLAPVEPRPVADAGTPRSTVTALPSATMRDRGALGQRGPRGPIVDSAATAAATKPQQSDGGRS